MNLVKFWLAFFSQVEQNKELVGPITNQLAIFFIFAAYLFISLLFKDLSMWAIKKYRAKGFYFDLRFY
jgi:hypothetical protein